MNIYSLLLRTVHLGVLAGIFGLASLTCASGSDTASKTTPTVGGVTNVVADSSTNAPPEAAATNSAPAKPKPGVTITESDGDDDTATDGKKHSATFTIDTDHDGGSRLEDILIPIVAIVSSLATPILIVFFFCYFKYKRRRESVALAREYLAKGIPVPPQLLDESQRDFVAPSPNGAIRENSDLRRGFRWTFAGLGVALALYVDSPHSTTWGWGLIPMVIGIGFLISGALQTRLERGSMANPNPPVPPAPGEPPR